MRTSCIIQEDHLFNNIFLNISKWEINFILIYEVY